MNITIRLLPLILAAAMQQGPVEPGWTERFNAKDLTGWKILGPEESFKVQDGAIVANGAASHAAASSAPTPDGRGSQAPQVPAPAPAPGGRGGQAAPPSFI